MREDCSSTWSPVETFGALKQKRHQNLAAVLVIFLWNSQAFSGKALPVLIFTGTAPRRASTSSGKKSVSQTFQGEIPYAPPPSPAFWPEGIFRGGGCKYFEAPPQQEFYTPPLSSPTPLERYFPGWGSVGGYKIWPWRHPTEVKESRSWRPSEEVPTPRPGKAPKKRFSSLPRFGGYCSYTVANRGLERR